jgi:hypothetical protein
MVHEVDAVQPRRSANERSAAHADRLPAEA